MLSAASSVLGCSGPSTRSKTATLDGVVGGDSALSAPSLVECAQQFRTVHVQVHAHRQTVRTNVTGKI
jgi:hypothetical protein